MANELAGIEGLVKQVISPLDKARQKNGAAPAGSKYEDPIEIYNRRMLELLKKFGGFAKLPPEVAKYFTRVQHDGMTSINVNQPDSPEKARQILSSLGEVEEFSNRMGTPFFILPSCEQIIVEAPPASIDPYYSEVKKAHASPQARMPARRVEDEDSPSTAKSRRAEEKAAGDEAREAAKLKREEDDAAKQLALEKAKKKREDERQKMKMNGFWKKMGWPVEQRGKWEDEETRAAATRWLVDMVLKIDPRKLTAKMLHQSRLGGMVRTYYRSSPYLVLKAAGYEIMPWEMGITPQHYFDERENRIAAIKWLVEKLGKKEEGREAKRPQDIIGDDFADNGLEAMLSRHYRNTPYLALIDAGYKIEPWEMRNVQKGYFDKRKNRLKAIRWLAKKLKKEEKIEARDITKRHFIEARLSAMLAKHYGERPFLALLDAGLVTKEDEHYMRARSGKDPEFEGEEKRIGEIDRRMKASRKRPQNMTYADLEKARLGYLLNAYYGHSPYRMFHAVYEYCAGRLKAAEENKDQGGMQKYRALAKRYDFHPWEMRNVPTGLFDDINMRVAAMRWLVEKTGKRPQDLCHEDFKKHRLERIFNGRRTGGIYALVREAGYDAEPWEMRTAPHNTFASRETRVAAMIWMYLTKLDKLEAREITRPDFIRSGLATILNYYRGSVYRALSDAGLVGPEDREYVTSNRVRAA